MEELGGNQVRDRFTRTDTLVVKNNPTLSERNLLDTFPLRNIQEALNKHDFASLVFNEIDAASLLRELPSVHEGSILYRSYFCYQVPLVPSPSDTSRRLRVFDVLSYMVSDPKLGVSSRIGIYILDDSIGVAAQPRFGDLPPTDSELLDGISSKTFLPYSVQSDERVLHLPSVALSLRQSLRGELKGAYESLLKAIPEEIEPYPGGSMMSFLQSPMSYLDSGTVFMSRVSRDQGTHDA